MNAERAPRHARRPRFARAVLVAVLPLALSGCEWMFTTFKDQPRIEPWEAEYEGQNVGFRGNPANSVAMHGGGVPEFMVGLGRYPTVSPLVIDSFAAMPNPIPADSVSLAMGRKYYQINCAVCHGAGGAGNGAMLQYGIAAPALVNDRVRGLSDGYLYGMIRNGRATMPNYARIEHRHRWDVVNYVRALQAGTADTSAVGTPGETGAALPGASPTAPTLPAPFVAPGGDGGPVQAAPDTAAPAAGDTAAAAPPATGEVRP